MLRKIVFATATTFGLALPLGMNSSAQAYPPTVVYTYPSPPPVVYSYPPPPPAVIVPAAPPVVVVPAPAYVVSYYAGHHHWYYYGTFASRWDADHAAHHLSHLGYTARIEVR